MLCTPASKYEDV